MKKKFLSSLIILFAMVSLALPFYSKAAVTCEAGYESSTGICLPSSGEIGITDRTVADLLSDVLSWLLYFIAFLTLIFIVYSGIQYVTSAGDEKKAETAKENLKYSVIGLLVALSALIVVRTIMEIIGD